MKILYITKEMLVPSLALQLKKEGHEVLCFVKEKESQKTLVGSLKHLPYKDRGKYVKGADLIIYDEDGNGDEPAKLRKLGYSVIGGSKMADKLDLDRKAGSKAAELMGLKVPFMKEINSLKEAKEYIISNPKRWVLKQEGELDGLKGLNFVSKFDDSRDLIDHLDWLEERWVEGLPQTFILQEHIKGIEMATGSYWNGDEFMKDKEGDEICEINFEHKELAAGSMGTATGEMFTLMRYQKAKETKLFMETLDKCRPLLKKIDFRGDVDVNCIINKDGVYFLEWTIRMGVPATSAQMAIHKTGWGELLKAMADGNQVGFEYDPRWTIVSWLYTKPFPSGNSIKIKNLIEEKYSKNPPKDTDSKIELLEARIDDSYGVNVYFKEPLTNEETRNVHMEYVYLDKGKIKVSNSAGYVLTITGQGDTVGEAGDNTQKLLKKLVVPKGFWRNDFGAHYFDGKDELEKLGYLDKEIIVDLEEKKSKKLKEEYEKDLQEMRMIHDKSMKESEAKMASERNFHLMSMKKMKDGYEKELKNIKQAIKSALYE